MKTIEYDREKAVLYAQKWALGANPNFYHFGGIGGDCTNFVSQCLLAGEAVMNYSPLGWFYKSLFDRSASWSGFWRTFTRILMSPCPWSAWQRKYPLRRAAAAAFSSR